MILRYGCRSRESEQVATASFFEGVGFGGSGAEQSFRSSAGFKRRNATPDTLRHPNPVDPRHACRIKLAVQFAHKTRRKRCATWLFVCFTYCHLRRAFAQPSRYSPSRIQKTIRQAGWWSYDVGSDSGRHVSKSSASTEKFKLVERHKIGAVLDERISHAARSAVDRREVGQRRRAVRRHRTVSASIEGLAETGGGLSSTESGRRKRKRTYSPSNLRVVDTTSGEVGVTAGPSRPAPRRRNGCQLYRRRFRRTYFSNYEKTPTAKRIRAIIQEIRIPSDRDGRQRLHASGE